MARKYWMAKAAEGIRRRGTEGALTRKAHRAGKSITEFCRSQHGARTGRQCGLAKAFRGARKGGRRRSGGSRG